MSEACKSLISRKSHRFFFHPAKARSLLKCFSMPRHASVLLIDDSPGERELFREALMRTDLDVVLYSEQDAEAALHFLKHRPELPSLILLDWHLRHERGDGFLRRLRSERRFAAIPVVAFTTSDEVADFRPRTPTPSTAMW